MDEQTKKQKLFFDLYDTNSEKPYTIDTVKKLHESLESLMDIDYGELTQFPKVIKSAYKRADALLKEINKPNYNIDNLQESVIDIYKSMSAIWND